VVVFGCGASTAPAREANARYLCDGLDAEACQDRTIVQSLCLAEPDGAGCDALRAGGFLPEPPPRLENLY
jgi:hypothetical protein